MRFRVNLRSLVTTEPAVGVKVVRRVSLRADLRRAVRPFLPKSHFRV